jgi:hypothetical protein
MPPFLPAYPGWPKKWKRKKKEKGNDPALGTDLSGKFSKRESPIVRLRLQAVLRATSSSVTIEQTFDELFFQAVAN